MNKSIVLASLVAALEGRAPSSFVPLCRTGKKTVDYRETVYIIHSYSV